MSYENVIKYFNQIGLTERIKNLEHSSATVEDAAKALNCEPKQIAKTMSFLLNDRAILIVTAGDTKIDNKKYKAKFNQKAKMIPREEVEQYIGHAPGGVCPFAINLDIPVYLDISLKRFKKVYPAAGNAHSAIELSIEELEKFSNCTSWIDVCSQIG